MVAFNLLAGLFKETVLQLEVLWLEFGLFFVRFELGVFGINQRLNFKFCLGLTWWLNFFHIDPRILAILQSGDELFGLLKACPARVLLTRMVDWENYVFVELLVHAQLARLAERFIAACILTFERLLPCVDVHMLLQILPKWKALKATFAGVLLDV